MEFQSSEKAPLPSHILDPIADEQGNVKIDDYHAFLLDRHDYLHQMTMAQIHNHAINVNQTETHMVRSAKAFGFSIRGVDGRTVHDVCLSVIAGQPKFVFYDKDGVPLHSQIKT